MAIKQGNTATISRYIEGPNGLKPNDRNSQEETALMIASSSGHGLPALKFLLDQESFRDYLEAVTPQGRRALHFACQNPAGSEAAKLLLEHGAHVDHFSADMIHPIQLAVSGKNFAAVKELIKVTEHLFVVQRFIRIEGKDIFFNINENLINFALAAKCWQNMVDALLIKKDHGVKTYIFDLFSHMNQVHCLCIEWRTLKAQKKVGAFVQRFINQSYAKIREISNLLDEILVMDDTESTFRRNLEGPESWESRERLDNLQTLRSSLTRAQMLVSLIRENFRDFLWRCLSKGR